MLITNAILTLKSENEVIDLLKAYAESVHSYDFSVQGSFPVNLQSLKCEKDIENCLVVLCKLIKQWIDSENGKLIPIIKESIEVFSNGLEKIKSLRSQPIACLN